MATLLNEARRLWAYRWQIWLDTVKDLVSENRETRGQLLWVVVLPLVPMALYLFLAGLRVFPVHDAIRGIPYVMVGALFWFLFSGLFLAPLSAVRRKAKVAAQSRYPLSGVIGSSVLQAWVEFLIRAVFVAVILAFTQTPSPWGAVGALFVALPLAALFLGLGTITAIFAVAWKDIDKLAGIIVQYLFFLSHVLFTLPESVVPRWLSWCNPFAFAIDTCRWFLMLGELPNPWLWAAWSCAGIAILLKALHFAAVSEPRLSAHL